VFLVLLELGERADKADCYLYGVQRCADGLAVGGYALQQLVEDGGEFAGFFAIVPAHSLFRYRMSLVAFTYPSNWYS
jgi:hypothetical protein